MCKRKFKIDFGIVTIQGAGKCFIGNKAVMDMDHFLERCKQDYGYMIKKPLEVKEGILKYYPTRPGKAAGYYLLDKKKDISAKVFYADI